MSRSWPPPPDLESIQELVRDADIEGFIQIHGAPFDEYDTEAEALYKLIANYPTADLTASRLLLLIGPIWQKNFNLGDGEEFTQRRPALLGLAMQIERFFGPGSRPQLRNRVDD